MKRLFIVTAGVYDQSGLSPRDREQLTKLRSLLPFIITHSIHGDSIRHREMADLFEPVLKGVHHISDVFGDNGPPPTEANRERRQAVSDFLLTLTAEETVWYADHELLQALGWPEMAPLGVYRIDIDSNAAAILTPLAEHGNILHDPQPRFKFKLILYPKAAPGLENRKW